MKKTNCIIFLFLSSFFVVAQEELEKGFYPFINYSENQIFLGQEKALTYFCENMDSLAKGEEKQVNIVHIGDSHIQADFFSNQIRKRSQKTFHLGNGGKGFIFPYRLAKTNNPNSYRVSYTGSWNGKRNSVSSHHYDWGVSGVVATTTSHSSTFSIQLNTQEDSCIHYNTNHIRVYYPVTDIQSFEIFIQKEDSLFTGIIDTLGGFIQFELDELVDKINFKLKKTNSTQRHFNVEGILLNNDESGIVFHSIGVNGAQFRSYLKCPKFIPQLKSINPHLIIISLGTNDVYGMSSLNTSDLKRNIEKLLGWIREACPNTSILLTCPSDNLYKRRSKNHNNGIAGKLYKELAKKHNLAIWDLYTIMGGLSSIYSWQQQGLAQGDFLHFSAKGYTLQGELLFRALFLDAYFGKYQQILKSQK